tara:strand:- start:1199 stop:2239 length:1041 start_codon:yes stop_codon:yes gene_type:complete
MRILTVISICFFNLTSYAQQDISEKYALTIIEQDLRNLLYVYASDYFEGRGTGSIGQKRATDFLRHFYKKNNIQPAKGTVDFFQEFNMSISGKRGVQTRLTLDKKGNVKSENVIAIIEGSEKPEEYIIISAHLDAIGYVNGKIHNGADDDGSGTVALLEIAEAFNKAKLDGHGPKRSIVFLHVSGEENGLRGSEFYTKNPVYELSKTNVNLNVDMIGRIDPTRIDKNPNYIYLIGSNRLSLDLHDVSEIVNAKTTNLLLDYKFNDPKDPNRFYERSDHYNFAKNNIPVIFYFSGTHEDYHKPSDTAEKIIYSLLAKRTKLIFHTAWELANRENRISPNIKQKILIN